MLEDCSKRTSRRKKCKGIKPVISTMNDIVGKVANYLAAVPIVGKIAKAIKYGLKIMEKAVTILNKVFKGLEKIDKLVVKAQTQVDKAKEKMDKFKPESDKYYTAFGHVYNCKQQVCNHKQTVEAAVTGPLHFHQSAYTVCRACGDTLKALNDGPLAFWLKIKSLIDSLMSVLDPIFDLVEKIFDLVSDMISKIAEAFNALKCCMPAPIQWLANAVTAVVDLAFCPIDGVLKSLSNQLGGMIKDALVGLAMKIVPKIKFTIPGWNSHTSLSVHVPGICGRHSLYVGYHMSWASWSVDTTQIDNAGADTPTFSSFCTNLANDVAEGCQQALNRFGEIFHTCDCPIPVIGPVINVINCFPGDATVHTPQGKKQMSQLNVGDCVLGSDGHCDEVYMFGHADHGMQTLYNKIGLSSGASIRMSNKHFIQTSKVESTLFAQAELKYSQDVVVGDWVWEANGKKSQVVTVLREVHTGAFNPYTKSGNIVVDGVMASSHSDWFLDDVAPTQMTRYLPGVYQGVLVINRALYDLMGPAGAEMLGLANDKTNAGNFWIDYWPAVAATLAAALVGATLGTKRAMKA